MSTGKCSLSGFAICGMVFAVVGAFALGYFAQNRAEAPATPQNKEESQTAAPAMPKSKEESQTVEKQNIDAYIKIERLVKEEVFGVSTPYSLVLVKPVPLRLLLESKIMLEILAIGAKAKFQLASHEEKKEWYKKIGKSGPLVVSVSKGEFTSQDEIVFSVYYPGVAN